MGHISEIFMISDHHRSRISKKLFWDLLVRGIWPINQRFLREESSDMIEKLVSDHGLPKTDAVIWADNGDEEPEKIETTVSAFWNEDGSGLVLRAECSAGNQKESASIVLKKERLSVYTPSNAEREEETEDEL